MPLPTPEQVQSLRDIGELGLVIIALIFFYTGRVLAKGGCDEKMKLKDDQIAAMTVERDEWKQVAKDSVEHVDRLSDALEGVIHGALPK